MNLINKLNKIKSSIRKIVNYPDYEINNNLIELIQTSDKLLREIRKDDVGVIIYDETVEDPFPTSATLGRYAEPPYYTTHQKNNDKIMFLEDLLEIGLIPANEITNIFTIYNHEFTGGLLEGGPQRLSKILKVPLLFVPGRNAYDPSDFINEKEYQQRINLVNEYTSSDELHICRSPYFGGCLIEHKINE